jgi:ferredoxin
MTYVLRVNPIACDGHGVCAELLPEIIDLDPWGYPVLRSATVPRGLVDHAKRAAAGCPTLALLLSRTTAGGGKQAVTRRQSS